LTKAGSRATTAEMMRLPWLAVLALAVGLGACGSWRSVDGQALGKKLRERKARDLLVVLRAPPAFQAEGPDAKSWEGDRTVELFGLVDPSIRIAGELGSRLARRYSLRAETVPEERRPRPRADLVLLVSTRRWGYGDVRGDLRHYRVYTRFNAVLTDGKSNDVLAEGDCEDEASPVRSRPEPTYKELIAGEGALIKEGLEAAATRCIEKYSRWLLALDAETPAPP
jgi:hypothetical protein